MAESERTQVSLFAFIEAWEGSDSVAEVAEKLGLKEGSVQARASKYRSGEIDENGKVVKKPIALKTMPRGGGARLQVDEANALLAKLRGKTVEEIAAEGDVLLKRKIERNAKRQAAAAAAEEGGEDTPEE